MASLKQTEERLYHADCVLTTYGLGYGGFAVDMPGQALTSTEFTFAYFENYEFSEDGLSEGWQVIAWTGSYPFAVDRVMGNFATIEEAARYAKWLLDRETFYQNVQTEQYERWLANHQHIMQETPDGYGCIICLYN